MYSIQTEVEKKVAEQLTSFGIECYCPLITVVRQWSDWKKKVEVPLLTLMYLFNCLMRTEI
jgi:hypothetical protein